MPYFREAQNQAHPNKTNTLMLGIILILIGIISIQIWFLYSALNNALKDNPGIAIAAFAGSLILFITGLLVIRFLPEPRRRLK
jgi:hypothetical protein